MGDVDWSDLWNINILANSNIWAENYFFFPDTQSDLAVFLA